MYNKHFASLATQVHLHNIQTHRVPPRHAWINTSFGLFLRNVQLAFVNGDIISLIFTAWPSLPNTQLSFPWLMTNMTKHSSFSRLSSWLIVVTASLISCNHFKQHVFLLNKNHKHYVTHDTWRLWLIDWSLLEHVTNVHATNWTWQWIRHPKKKGKTHIVKQRCTSCKVRYDVLAGSSDVSFNNNTDSYFGDKSFMHDSVL